MYYLFYLNVNDINMEGDVILIADLRLRIERTF